MWNALRTLNPRGYHFRRQVPLGPYYADFACHHPRLVIEIDGLSHTSQEYDAKRDLFMEMAASRGIAEGSEAHARLLEWLGRRPSEEFFDAAMGVIRAILDAQSHVGGTTAADIVALCKQVASASGGLLGFGRKISDAERELIERIAGEIAQEKPEAARQVVEDL